MYVILKELLNNSYIGTFVFWDHQARSCIRQLLEGLDYLHHLSIIHLDIKVCSQRSTLIVVVSCKDFILQKESSKMCTGTVFHCFSLAERIAKNIFSYSLLSLITSSWQTPTVIRSESVTSAMQWCSHPTRLSIANMALQNLLRQKLSIRPLCQKHQTSGKAPLEIRVCLFCLNPPTFF